MNKRSRNESKRGERGERGEMKERKERREERGEKRRKDIQGYSSLWGTNGSTMKWLTSPCRPPAK